MPNFAMCKIRCPAMLQNTCKRNALSGTIPGENQKYLNPAIIFPYLCGDYIPWYEEIDDKEVEDAEND